MIKKLQNRGDVSENRIQEIEKSLKRQVEITISNEMEKRVEILEKQTNINVKSAIGERSLRWKIPFLVLVIIIVVVLGIAYLKYRDMQKTHLL